MAERRIFLPLPANRFYQIPLMLRSGHISEGNAVATWGRVREKHPNPAPRHEYHLD